MPGYGREAPGLPFAAPAAVAMNREPEPVARVAEEIDSVTEAGAATEAGVVRRERAPRRRRAPVGTAVVAEAAAAGSSPDESAPSPRASVEPEATARRMSDTDSTSD